ncbi:MAG: hypothetical protein J6K41_00825 [Paraprevotella sp.]|nr:hypothetical protein [Paraprevotella sp.]
MMLSERLHDKYVKWVWAYLLLFIFEGALRKWIAPGLSTPLLMARTPIVIYMGYIAYKRNWMNNPYAKGLMVMSSICFFTALLFGHHNLFIAAFGWHDYFLHFPFIVIAAKILNREDVIKMGRCILYISVPMTLLIIQQFYSPQSAWVNIGVGGEGSSGFGGAMGYYRPSGTFAFTSGYTAFESLVCAFLIFYFMENSNLPKQLRIKKVWLYVIAFCYLLCLPYSMSRSMVFTTVLIFAFVFLCSTRNMKSLKKIIIATIALAFVMVIVLQSGFLGDSVAAITERFDQASRVEGGLEGTIGDRYIGGFFKSLFMDVPIFGYGLGIGTNVGAKYINGDMFTLFNAESGFGLTIGETGVLLGLFFIYFRFAWAFKLFVKGLRQRNNTLAMCLLPSMCLTLSTGGIGAVPMMGYLVCVSFLGSAALKK